jgi:hypothetical protein
MAFAPIYMLKRIFPQDCLGLVDISGNGTPDALLIEGINILMPISMPKTMNLGNYTIDDVEKFGSVTIDGVKMNLDSQTILSDVFLFIGGELYSLGDLFQGKAAGKKIAMGDRIKLVVKLDSFAGLQTEAGVHKIAIEFDSGSSETPFSFAMERELLPEKMNLTLET